MLDDVPPPIAFIHRIGRDLAPVRDRLRCHDERPIEDAPEFSDETLALRFADQHQHDLRYVSAWGRWLQYTGQHWVFDDTLHAFDRARKVCREAASECNDTPRVAAAVASAKTVAAVERLAKADRRLAATISQWDSD